MILKKQGDYLVGAAGAPGTGDMLLWCQGLSSSGVGFLRFGGSTVAAGALGFRF